MLQNEKGRKTPMVPKAEGRPQPPMVLGAAIAIIAVALIVIVGNLLRGTPPMRLE